MAFILLVLLTKFCNEHVITYTCICQGGSALFQAKYTQLYLFIKPYNHCIFNHLGKGMDTAYAAGTTRRLLGHFRFGQQRILLFQPIEKRQQRLQRFDNFRILVDFEFAQYAAHHLVVKLFML